MQRFSTAITKPAKVTSAVTQYRNYPIFQESTFFLTWCQAQFGGSFLRRAKINVFNLIHVFPTDKVNYEY